MKKFSVILVFIFLILTLAAVQAAGNRISTPDRSRDMIGWYSSLKLDSAGSPVISYLDATNGDLKLLHCDDPYCVGPGDSITVPDAVGIVGFHTSLVLDSSGNPVVSYFSYSDKVLKLLHCNDPDCAGGDDNISIADASSGLGGDTSLVLDDNGFPVISYSGNKFKILHCNDINCTGDDESVSIPDPSVSGWYNSLALDGDGYPVVSYWDNNIPGALKLLHCNDPNCQGGDESIIAVDTGGYPGAYNSMILDGNGYPTVAYRKNDGVLSKLNVLHCNDPNCAGGDESIVSLDPGSTAIEWISLALDGTGNPVVSFWDIINGYLRLLHCNDVNCTGGNDTVTVVDRQGPPGQSSGEGTSLALDSNDYPLISYFVFDAIGAGDLKLAVCGDVGC